MMKYAVIVGATGTIGSAIVKKLELNGYKVFERWLDANRPDASIEASYKNLPEKIDCAIYVPGLNVIKPTVELSEAEWDSVFDINMKGAFFLATHSYESLKMGENPFFLTISSILAQHPYPNRTAYAASKGAVESFTRSLATEWGQVGIATHCIRLGHVSSFMKSSPPNPELLNAAKSKTPAGNLIEADDVADYVLWLAKGGAKSVNGQIIDFDGGYSFNRWPL